MTQTDRFMRDSTSIRIPADFKYKDILLKGRPVHDRYDPFRIDQTDIRIRDIIQIAFHGNESSYD